MQVDCPHCHTTYDVAADEHRVTCSDPACPVTVLQVPGHGIGLNTAPHTLPLHECPTCHHPTSRGWLEGVYACINTKCRVIQYHHQGDPP